VTERVGIHQQLIDHQFHLEKMVYERTADLRIALEAAKIADQAKDSFLANVTHELRTPLSAVIGFSGLARPLSTDPRQQEYLDKINSAGKTLSNIIDDLLDLSKIAAGRMTLEATTFSLYELLDRSRATMSFKADEKGLQLNAHIDAAVPDVLYGDPLRLEQILLNLLSNAVKFTTAGRIELRVGLHACDADRVCLNIEVEDSGIGMQEEDLKLLFKPFSQTDASMSRKFGGTGLGLAICKRIAELMDGRISVNSRPGSGTTFAVELWIAPGNKDDLPENARPGEQDTQRVSYRDARVLVVDDQPFNRDVVEGLLAAVGIRPRLAVNGREALDLLIDSGPEAFDLVLMDVQMPVMDGMTATRELRMRSEFAELPVVAMTAHTMAHEKELGKAAGMDDHIGKPFDDVSFYRILKKWIPLAKQRLQEAAPVPQAERQAGSLPQLRGIDMHAGLSLLLGDEARYRHWLCNFVDEGPGYVAQISKALAMGEPAQAALAAHTLKGRGGMLGMGELHSLAAALELALDGDEPAHTLLIRLEQSVEMLCAEIKKGLGLPESPQTAPEPAAESAPKPLPEGPLPDSVQRLIVMLEAGNSDSDTALANCLEKLAGTPWAPHLQQVLADVQNFDFPAAAARLSPVNNSAGQER
jgi:CheY-like chemotaxis protein